MKYRTAVSGSRRWKAKRRLLRQGYRALMTYAYASEAQLRTLQRRIKVWRAERVRELILGGLRKSADTPIEA
jgi:hypothetical protein